MSQPPGGQQPEGVPGYAPPQDPWGNDGFETGVASVPTDPIPQYSSSYADMGYPTQPAWPQQGQAYPYVPQQPQRSKAAPVILTILAVLVVGGGGGYGAWYYLTQRGTTTNTNHTPTTAATSTGRPWDISTVRIGDCITVDNSDPTNPKPSFQPCGSGSYQVSAIRHGADIAQDNDGKLNQDEAQRACSGTDYTNYYAFDAENSTANDYVLCLKKM
jgi:hypothetical protein